MRFKKSACALLLGGSLSVLNIGCAAVDALVSSPAGHSAHGDSPQRMAAIGRVFENQGRYAQARTMYRQALRSDPDNTAARDRLEYLASMSSPASGRSATEEAFALADVVAPPKTNHLPKLRLKRPEREVSADIAEPSIRMVRAFESAGQVQSAALTVGEELEVILPEASETEAAVVVWQKDVEAVGGEMDSEYDAVGHVTFTSEFEDSGDEMADSMMADSRTEELGVVSRQAAQGFRFGSLDEPAADAELKTPQCTELELFPETEHVAEVGLWRPARGSVSLADVLQWSDAPEAHEGELIDATRNGIDAGVKALAVAMLGEVSQPGGEVVTALRQSAMTQNPMVRVAALDALVLQGKSDSETVDNLLGLLAGDDPGIQAKAAATLIRTANTEWRDEAIAGLNQLLQDENDNVVAVAATSLSEFGEAAIGCRERLTAVAASTSSELVLEATSMALTRIPRPEQ